MSCQRTHERRELAFQALKNLPNSVINETAGFTQGFESGVYAAAMCSAKVAPAPSGAVSPDSFRLYEALESHCVPLADDVSPLESYDSRGYWRTIFDNPPFAVYTEAADIPGYVRDQLAAWPANANRIAAYWMRFKREMTLWLQADLRQLGAI